jgi:hypothetical protein
VKRLVALTAVALLLIGTGVALASIPDSANSATPGRIHGCYKTSNPAKGSVVVVNAEAGESCPSGFAALTWGPPILSIETHQLTLTGGTQTEDVYCADLTDSAISFTAVQPIDYGTDYLQSSVGSRQWNDGIRFLFPGSTQAGTFDVVLACFDNVENF